MIDHEARNRLAEAIRHFVAGRMDNFQFDRFVWSIQTKDAAVVQVRREMWHSYDDIRRHKLKGKWAISEAQKETIERFILFLTSDIAYRWPPRCCEIPIVRLFLGALTFGLVPRYLDRKWKQNGNWEVWPFLTASEFNEAKQNAVYFANTK